MSKVKERIGQIGCVLAFVLFAAWVVNIVYLFWLGSHTGWISGDFLFWEGISLAEILPALVIGMISPEFLPGGKFNI